MDFLGIHSIDLPISNADFSQIAQGMGAVGLKIRTEGEVQDVLAEAMQLSQPVVIDVLIDETEVSPLFKRFENLSLQSHPDHVSGWEQ
jgi:acetolactate synthase-1/2/3 large subunit